MLSRLTRSLGVVAVLFAAAAPVAGAKADKASKKVAPKAKSAHHIAPNTGKPGSACSPVQFEAEAPADSGSLDTTSLGPTAAVRYEIGGPTNAADRDKPAKRVMVFLHGGGWYTVGQGALNVTQGSADRWREVGWETVNLDYLPCGRSIRSALKMYDLVRAHYGASVPICVTGDSSGAQLALLIASRRPDVSCVIANGPPTDLVRIARQGVNATLAGLAPKLLAEGALAAAGKAVAAFGLLGVKAASPIRHAASISARVLLATAADDVMIPIAQVASMARAITGADPTRYVDSLVVSPGSLSFAHGTASPEAVDDYYHHVADLVAPFGSAPGQPQAAPEADPFKELLSVLFPRRK